MEDKIKTSGLKFICMECRNEVTCDTGLDIDEVIECSFCGIEYEVIERDGDELILEIIEEEK